MEVGEFMIKHLGTIELETERLLLRKCIESDYHDSYKYCCSDRELCRLQGLDVHKNDNVTRKSFIEKVEQYKVDPSFYEWAIINKETNTFMGEIALVHYDEKNNSFETGYHLGKIFRGNGYMQEALAAVIEFAFEKLNINSFYALILKDNISSQKCVTHIGLTYSNTIDDYKDDVYEGPIDKYEITKEQYYQKKNFNLRR